MKPRELFSALLVVTVALAASGCRFAVPEGTTQPGGPAPGDVALTQNQVRLRMRGLVGPMCGEIEQAADRIVAGTTNPAVQRAAVEWKIEAIPALREALFQPDPLTAVIDTWVLCNQMADYFDTGPGRAALGDSSSIAVATCRGLEETVAQVEASRTVSGDVSRVRAYARQWAADHPIEHSIAGRESTLTRVLDRDAMGTLSTGEVMAEVTTAVDDLHRRLEVYSSQLPRQARWEADLFKAELLAEARLDQALPLAGRAVKSAEQAAAAVERLAPALERAVVVAEGTPRLVTAEREAAIRALQEELASTIRFAQEERIAALAHLTQERVATMKSLTERLELERKALTEQFHQSGLMIVDRAFIRGAQLIACTVVALFTGAVLLLFLARRLFPPARRADP